jgi:hypothetical protein
MAKKPIPYHYFLCEIILKKRNFLGLITSQIIIVISLDLKSIILKTDGKNNNFPFKKTDIIDLKILKEWAIINNYSIDFFTKSRKLKLLVNCHFDDVNIKKPNNKTIEKLKNIFNQVRLFIKK